MIQRAAHLLLTLILTGLVWLWGPMLFADTANDSIASVRTIEDDAAVTSANFSVDLYATLGAGSEKHLLRRPSVASHKVGLITGRPDSFWLRSRPTIVPIPNGPLIFRTVLTGYPPCLSIPPPRLSDSEGSR